MEKHGNIEVLFLTHKIKVSVTAGSGINEGGKITGKIVGATGTVS